MQFLGMQNSVLAHSVFHGVFYFREFFMSTLQLVAPLLYYTHSTSTVLYCVRTRIVQNVRKFYSATAIVIAPCKILYGKSKNLFIKKLFKSAQNLPLQNNSCVKKLRQNMRLTAMVSSVLTSNKYK